MEPTPFEKCGMFILNQLFLDPGLDGRCREETPYGSCTVLCNKPYCGIRPVTVALKRYDSGRYEILADPGSPAFSRAEQVAQEALERFGGYGIGVEVLAAGDAPGAAV